MFPGGRRYLILQACLFLRMLFVTFVLPLLYALSVATNADDANATINSTVASVTKSPTTNVNICVSISVWHHQSMVFLITS